MYIEAYPSIVFTRLRADIVITDSNSTKHLHIRQLYYGHYYAKHFSAI